MPAKILGMKSECIIFIAVESNNLAIQKPGLEMPKNKILNFRLSQTWKLKYYKSVRKSDRPKKKKRKNMETYQLQPYCPALSIFTLIN